MARQTISNMNHSVVTDGDETKMLITFGEETITFSSKDSFSAFFQNIDLVYAKAFQEGEIHMLSNIALTPQNEGA